MGSTIVAMEFFYWRTL